MIKRALSIFLLITFTYSFLISKESESNKTPSFVVDEVGILTSKEKNLLQKELSDFETKTSVEILLYITETLNEQPIEDYAQGLFNTEGIGKKEVNNGVLILLAPNDRQLRIAVGYGMEWILPDSSTQIIVNDMVALLKEDKYFEASKLGVSEIMEKSAPFTWYSTYSTYTWLQSDISNSLNKIARIQIEKIAVDQKSKKNDYRTATLKIKKGINITLIYTKYMEDLINDIKNNPEKEVIVRVSKTEPLTVQLLGIKEI